MRSWHFLTISLGVMFSPPWIYNPSIFASTHAHESIAIGFRWKALFAFSKYNVPNSTWSLREITILILPSSITSIVYDNVSTVIPMLINIGWGTYKINLSTNIVFHMTLWQRGKKIGDVDNFIGKNLDLSKCQGTRWNGDNPLTPYLSPTTTTFSPTFYHRFPYGYSVMTTFFPLTISGRPLFYYIYFPDKKGRVSVRRGETSLRVLEDHFYPLQRGNR